MKMKTKYIRASKINDYGNGIETANSDISLAKALHGENSRRYIKKLHDESDSEMFKAIGNNKSKFEYFRGRAMAFGNYLHNGSYILPTKKRK